MLTKLNNFQQRYQYQCYLITFFFNLFGSLFIIDDNLFSNFLFPIGLLLNLIFGIQLIQSRKIKKILLVFYGISIIFSLVLMFISNSAMIRLIRFGLYFLFYSVIAYEIIVQIWKVNKVDEKIIYGVVSGYMTLGLLGFFIFMTVEINHPNSFGGNLLTQDPSTKNILDNLLYYSYITILTIGYGDIVPLTTLAQKAAILIALMGQFYMVIITGVVVGKFINTKS